MEDKSVIACSIFFYFVGVMEISGIEMLNESKKRNLLNERLINGTLLLNSKKFGTICVSKFKKFGKLLDQNFVNLENSPRMYESNEIKERFKEKQKEKEL